MPIFIYNVGPLKLTVCMCCNNLSWSRWNIKRYLCRPCAHTIYWVICTFSRKLYHLEPSLPFSMFRAQSSENRLKFIMFIHNLECQAVFMHNNFSVGTYGKHISISLAPGEPSSHTHDIDKICCDAGYNFLMFGSYAYVLYFLYNVFMVFRLMHSSSC